MSNKPLVPKHFDLEFQWQQYLLKGEIAEQQIWPAQRREMKRAFYGACGQMLLLFTGELVEYVKSNGSKAAANMIDAMLDQVESFWRAEIDKLSGRAN